METWLTYAPGDFLLFSAETYWRLFARANAALFPLPVAATLAVLGLLAAALSGARRTGLAAGVVLAAGWLVVAEAFLGSLYQPINWAIANVRPAFWAEAALLALLGPRLAFPSAGWRRGAGVAAVALAVLYPALAPLAGRPLAEAEVAGIAPDPTAIATLGLLLLARPGWVAGGLAVVPVVWLVLSGATLLTMGAATAAVPLAAALATAVLMLAALVRPRRPTEEIRR